MMQAVAYYEAALKQGGQQFLRSVSISVITCITPAGVICNCPKTVMLCGCEGYHKQFKKLARDPGTGLVLRMRYYFFHVQCMAKS